MPPDPPAAPRAQHPLPQGLQDWSPRVPPSTRMSGQVPPLPPDPSTAPGSGSTGPSLPCPPPHHQRGGRPSPSKGGAQQAWNPTGSGGLPFPLTLPRPLGTAPSYPSGCRVGHPGGSHPYKDEHTPAGGVGVRDPRPPPWPPPNHLRGGRGTPVAQWKRATGATKHAPLPPNP